MHRDVKPRNVIIDRRNKILKLIDFGHTDYLMAGKQYSNRVSSRSPSTGTTFRLQML